MDESFKDDVTVNLLLGVSIMGLTIKCVATKYPYQYHAFLFDII